MSKNNENDGKAVKVSAKRLTGAGRFAYEGLDRIMHEKARLSIMTSLLANPDGVIFNDLKKLCALTDGNLSRHLQILQENGLLEIWKGVSGNRPQTLCRLSATGRARFMEYLSELEQVIHDGMAARAKSKPQSEQAARNKLKNWQPA